nr:sugar ABC transporter permease [uncultured Blautia sp.]
MNKFKKLTRDQRKWRTAIIMLLPALVFLALLIAYPLGKVIHDAFYHVHLINKSLTGFAGAANFQKVLADEHFGQTVKNTAYWTIFSVLGEYLVGMVTAVLLNQKFKGRAIFRTCIFIPWLVPIIVAGMTWDWMLNPEFGIINYMLTNMHIISEPINFLGDSKYAMATVIFVNIWRSFPYYTISFLSAMQSIPGDLSEAAAIDGAGVFKRFFRVTLPQLRSVSLVIVFIHIIWTAINFDFIWVMTEGGPNYATETLPLMIYRYSMKKFDVGAASALSTMMFTVMVVLFIFYYRKRSSLSDEMA